MSARRYAVGVTETNGQPLGTYKDELAELAKAADRVRRAEKALDDLRNDVVKPQTVRAMKAGIAEGVLGVRSEVTAASPFSAPTVRALADANGIPPDQRYVRPAKSSKRLAEPQARGSAASGSGSGSGVPDVPEQVRNLPAPEAERLALAAVQGAEGGWEQRVLARYPRAGANWRSYILVAAALDEGLVRAEDLPG